MEETTNKMLIEKAKSVVKPKKVGDYLVGDVGCALLTANDNIYLGVCIDAGSGIGFCAEHNAIGAMVTAGEFRINKIVAVWLDENRKLHILSPCGRCREFIRQIHPDNIETKVIMDTHQEMTIAELLPYHDWFHKIDES